MTGSSGLYRAEVSGAGPLERGAACEVHFFGFWRWCLGVFGVAMMGPGGLHARGGRREAEHIERERGRGDGDSCRFSSRPACSGQDPPPQ